jgi:hypothetical protein
LNEKKYETVELSRAECDELPEYSCSIPTDPNPGFRWKCNNDAFGPRSAISLAEEKMADVFPDWWMAEAYHPDPPTPGYISIRWKKILLKEVP